MIIDFENNVDQTGLINKIYNFKSKQIIKAFNKALICQNLFFNTDQNQRIDKIIAFFSYCHVIQF